MRYLVEIETNISTLVYVNFVYFSSSINIVSIHKTNKPPVRFHSTDGPNTKLGYKSIKKNFSSTYTLPLRFSLKTLDFNPILLISYFPTFLFINSLSYIPFSKDYHTNLYWFRLKLNHRDEQYDNDNKKKLFVYNIFLLLLFFQM